MDYFHIIECFISLLKIDCPRISGDLKGTKQSTMGLAVEGKLTNDVVNGSVLKDFWLIIGRFKSLVNQADDQLP